MKDIDNYKGYKGDIDNIDVGKSKLFGKKVELDTDDYQNLVKYAKKGIVADVEITKLKEENSAARSNSPFSPPDRSPLCRTLHSEADWRD